MTMLYSSSLTPSRSGLPRYRKLGPYLENKSDKSRSRSCSPWSVSRTIDILGAVCFSILEDHFTISVSRILFSSLSAFYVNMRNTKLAYSHKEKVKNIGKSIYLLVSLLEMNQPPGLSLGSL